MVECWLQVTSGRGPDECCWVAARVVEAICKEASTCGCKVEVIEFVEGGRPGIFKSALLSVSGESGAEFVEGWVGTIQWIGQSEFRPHHKRKNWYVGVEKYKVPDDKELSSNDFKFETMRSSGPGGQHTNKTESAVRVTHMLTGISAVASGDRSQHMNRKLAVKRLYDKLEEQKQNNNIELQKDRWSDHNSLERGNPVRVFAGVKFKEKG